jgi:hypothetical protein
MWIVVFFVITAVMGMLMEMPKLWKSRKTKELWLFVLLLVTGTVFGIAVGLKMPMPNPLDFIKVVFGPLARAMYNMLS